MPLLVDSHIFLWAITSDKKLPKKISNLIEEEELVYVSIVSLWELILKANTGKLVFPASIVDELGSYGYELLPIGIDHLKEYSLLPNIHNDPFDRMIIAQAKQEQLQLVTSDKEILKYDVKCLEVRKA